MITCGIEVGGSFFTPDLLFDPFELYGEELLGLPAELADSTDADCFPVLSFRLLFWSAFPFGFVVLVVRGVAWTVKFWACEFEVLWFGRDVDFADGRRFERPKSIT